VNGDFTFHTNIIDRMQQAIGRLRTMFARMPRVRYQEFPADEARTMPINLT
jgi:hypothetical protein